MKNRMRNGMTEATSTILIIVIMAIGIVSWNWSQRYVKVTEDTAEKGIVFTRSIDLNKYEKIGDGSGIMGKYELYTRSIKMGNQQTIDVYIK
jgi:hypothetical protein